VRAAFGPLPHEAARSSYGINIGPGE
jgi:hypothetical protein